MLFSFLRGRVVQWDKSPTGIHNIKIQVRQGFWFWAKDSFFFVRVYTAVNKVLCLTEQGDILPAETDADWKFTLFLRSVANEYLTWRVEQALDAEKDLI